MGTSWPLDLAGTFLASGDQHKGRTLFAGADHRTVWAPPAGGVARVFRSAAERSGRRRRARPLASLATSACSPVHSVAGSPSTVHTSEISLVLIQPGLAARLGLSYQFYHYRFYQLGPDNSCYRTYQFRADNVSARPHGRYRNTSRASIPVPGTQRSLTGE